MRRMISDKAQKYIKDLATNHPDPSAEWGGDDYTAGNGIDITEGVISVDYGTGLTVDNETLIVDTSAIATKTDLFSGSYNDLTDKPDLSVYAESADLATVATTGAYSDLTGTPTIPAAQVQSDWSQSDNTQVDYIKNKPTIPAAVSGTNDGTNWTNLTIGSDTYAIPQGGGSSYTFTNGLTESSGTVSWDLNDIVRRGAVEDSLVLGKVYNKNTAAARAKGALKGGYRQYSNGTDATDGYGDITGKAGILYIYSEYNEYANPSQVSGAGGVLLGNNQNSSSANAQIGGFIYLTGSNSLNESSLASRSISLGRCVRSDGQGTHQGSLTIGEYNYGDATFLRDKAFIIGNGTAYNNLSNAMTVDWNGNMTIAGSITANNIVSQATSTSTVTPSTVQLTFTYSDNTTETITLMTGASVSTTTTLS